MNHYPAWKNLLIAIVIAVGALFALPNIYGSDPALQISPERGSMVDAVLAEQIKTSLAEADLTAKDISWDERQMLVRFSNTDEQLRGQDAVSKALGQQYIVALNLAPSTPEWLLDIGALPMYLGLDLRGGVHFLMEVDMQAVADKSEESYISDLKTGLRGENIRYRGITREDGKGIEVELRDTANLEKTENYIRQEFPDLNILVQENGRLQLSIKPEVLKETNKFALQQNITTLRKRVNELGVAEPTIQQQGLDRIVVQLPGVQDTAVAKEILGATATLEFRMVDQTNEVQDALDGKLVLGSKLYYDRDGIPHLLNKDVMLTGDHIIKAASGLEQTSGSPAVFITLDGEGARKFSRATRDNIGKPMAVVYIEKKTVPQEIDGERVKTPRNREEVINIDTIREQLSKSFQITGLDTTEEARKLALLLRAGALAAPVEIIEERTVGPSLGQDNIDKGLESVLIGLALVLVFMAVYYKGFGMIANLALVFNLVLIVALLSMLQATLTLPGIAGIVLTVGMAVDANVLIFERIREELRSGNTPQNSIHSGYDKAFSTIMDANITTLIAALVLFGFGTGPIKGFAVTLALGILTSMFTAIMGTRAVVNMVYGGRRLRKLSI